MISQQQASRPNSGGISNNFLVIVLLIGIVLLLAVLLIVVVFFLFKYWKRENTTVFSEKVAEELIVSQKTGIEEKITNSPVLSKQWEILSLEDKHILKVLVQNGGNILQKKLPSLTDYSKSTITRILTRLEDQDLIYRVPAGRGYRVFIKDQ
ncbi:MAG: helix-turn-helix transcriptional regulator [Promethearchaeota archaeon]